MSSKVYIMSNKAMPGLVKIGWTSKNDVEQRRKELSNTSVPYPFVVEATYDVYVDSADKIIHQWFPRELRVNDNREFFNITVDYAKKVIEDYRDKGRVFWGGEDEDEEEPNAMDVAPEVKDVDKQNNDRFSFGYLNIPIGATLTWYKDSSITCVVKDADSHVTYNGMDLSLSKLTTIVSGNPEHTHGPPRWKYNGNNLWNMFKEKKHANHENSIKRRMFTFSDIGIKNGDEVIAEDGVKCIVTDNIKNRISVPNEPNVTSMTRYCICHNIGVSKNGIGANGRTRFYWKGRSIWGHAVLMRLSGTQYEFDYYTRHPEAINSPFTNTSN